MQGGSKFKTLGHLVIWTNKTIKKWMTTILIKCNFSRVGSDGCWPMFPCKNPSSWSVVMNTCSWFAMHFHCAVWHAFAGSTEHSLFLENSVRQNTKIANESHHNNKSRQSFVGCEWFKKDQSCVMKLSVTILLVKTWQRWSGQQQQEEGWRMGWCCHQPPFDLHLPWWWFVPFVPQSVSCLPQDKEKRVSPFWQTLKWGGGSSWRSM